MLCGVGVLEGALGLKGSNVCLCCGSALWSVFVVAFVVWCFRTVVGEFCGVLPGKWFRTSRKWGFRLP